MPKHRHRTSSSYKDEPKHIYFWIWSCCQCGHAGMTVTVEQCPNYGCGHTRCTYCVTECHKRRNEGGGGGYPSTLGVNSTWATPPDTEPDRGSKSFVSSPFSKTTNVDLTTNRATMNDVHPERNPMGSNGSVTKFPSPEPFQVENIKAQDGVLTGSTSTSPSNWTDTSEVVTTAFKDMKTSLESDTEVETMESDSTEEASDIEEFWFERDAITIESCLLHVLDYNLDLAARLIPKIHALAYISIQSTLADADPQDTEGSGSARDHPSSSSTPTTSNQSSPQASRSRKREIHRNSRNDRDESGEREGSRRSKRRKPSPSRTNMPTFACHFYKLDPDKYSGWIHRKYRTCACPSVPHDSLRRIKDHFKTHKSRQCDRCYRDFEGIDQLMAHRRAEPCDTRSPSLKEGIDDSQAERIDCLLKTKRGTNPSEKPKLEIEKWYQIWRVLFPDAPEPSNPWSQPKSSSKTESYDPESVVNRFERIVNQDIHNGTLRPAFETHHYINALRRAFDEETNQSPELQVSESPESNIEDVANQGTGSFLNIARHTANVESTLNRLSPVSQSMNPATSRWTNEYESGYNNSQNVPGPPNSTLTVRIPELQDRPSATPWPTSTYQAPTQGRADLSITQTPYFQLELLGSQAPDPETSHPPNDSFFEQTDLSMTEPFDFDLEFGSSTTPTQSFNFTTQEHDTRNTNTFNIDSASRELDYDPDVDTLTALLASENELPSATDPRYKTKYVGRHGLQQL